VPLKVKGTGDVDATASISPTTFYPVVDNYVDRLDIEGARGERTSVDVHIVSAGTEATVFEHSTPTDTGDYRVRWNGMTSGGELAPPGLYDVSVTLSDTIGNTKVVEKRITLSHDYVTWKKKSVTAAGRNYSLVGRSKNAVISSGKSGYSGGVRLASNKGFAAVVYVFPVRNAKIYGTMRFEALGKSTNKHKALIDNYDAAKVVGSRYKWWKTSTPGQVHVKNGKARATLMVWKGLGRKGGSTFDIRKVRLVYKVGKLHSVAGASVAGTSLETELRTAARKAATGPSVADVAGDRSLPKVRLREDPGAPPAADPTEDPMPTSEPITREEPTPAPSRDPEPEPTVEPSPVPSAGPTPEPEPPAPPTSAPAPEPTADADAEAATPGQ
jgi:hypothetical protein